METRRCNAPHHLRGIAHGALTCDAGHRRNNEMEKDKLAMTVRLSFPHPGLTPRLRGKFSFGTIQLVVALHG
jgi:hypothetical protein